MGAGGGGGGEGKRGLEVTEPDDGQRRQVTSKGPDRRGRLPQPAREQSLLLMTLSTDHSLPKDQSLILMTLSTAQGAVIDSDDTVHCPGSSH